jgi:hypothetical protein
MLEDSFGSTCPGTLTLKELSQCDRFDDSPCEGVEVTAPSQLLYRCPGRVRDSRAVPPSDPRNAHSREFRKQKDDIADSPHDTATSRRCRFDSLKSLNTSFVFDMFATAVTHGSQVYIHRSAPLSQCDSKQTGTLWHLTTTFTTRSSDTRPHVQTSCFVCRYPHPRRVCPLVRCRFCCQYGHLQYVCPLRRINSRMIAAKNHANSALTLSYQKY